MSAASRQQRRITEPLEYYFPIRGGLDLITPPYQIAPGKMLDCFRFELAASGGAKPIDGYERVSGIGIPSEAVFQYVEFVDVQNLVSVGIRVTGSISGATGISLAVKAVLKSGVVDLTGTGAFLLTSGVFVDGDILTADGLTVATISKVNIPNISTTDEYDMHLHWLAVEMLRAMVEKVPGAGPVRGVWKFNGKLYAFRDNEAGTACMMYREDLVTQWALVTTPALLPSGKYKFENTNFGGSTSTIKMYGCDGVNKAFEFDGTTFNQITTGMTVDAPVLIVEHVKHLFLGFRGGSLQHSPPTTPRATWSVVINAGELGMGEELVEAKSLPGGVLGIFCKDSIHLLSGTGVGTWALAHHSKETGAIPGTVQNVGKIILLNNTGLADFSATNAFGSFKSATICDTIQPLINARKGGVIGSVAVQAKGQYRIFFDDGYSITATFVGGKVFYTQSHYDKNIVCISAPVRADDELGSIYFGSDDGYVYKMDSGVSLDETPMTAYMRMPYSHQGYPRRKKRYREVVVELDSFSTGDDVSLAFCPDFNLTDPDVPLHRAVNISESGALPSGQWNVSNWNNFAWSAGGGAGGGGTASGRVDGVATEMGLMILFNALNTVTPPKTINGCFIYYNLLGRAR